ncbi:MAG: CDP-alcohol phosphatidyltransferase [Bacteroidetes bacterium OLB9]|nr:MAG: CDP-alcohol phosphatidyltransferase [Bacteroidetes bacterium OLB9]MCZ2337683.1 DUF4833 domain-containing protein [Chitinophagales bacterium]
MISEDSLFKTLKSQSSDEYDRPTHYPIVEDYDELLFYIQRSQNYNTVIYEINMLPGHTLNLNKPISISWLKHTNGEFEDKQPLNYIQKKLAYGYQHRIISEDLIEFRIVSCEALRFFIAKNKNNRFRVFFNDNGENIELISVFVYAEDLGVFPQVKSAEIFGRYSTSGASFYKKIVLDTY